MQHLTLVGLTEDKSTLRLVSDSGEEFSVPVDADLRAAVREVDARPGHWEKKMDSALRPRDIQARIRAGESPESVAEAAQSTVERIMRYASPVLAERAHIAERAQRASVRRKGSEGSARILGEIAEERLRAANVDPDSVDWDAWRREDGRWALVADYRTGEQRKRGEFIFDVQGRYVLTENDDARWLVGDEVATAPPRGHAPGSSPRRLAAVSPQDDLLLGDDAIEMVSDTDEQQEAPRRGPWQARQEVGPDERTVDLTQTAWEVRRDRGGKSRSTGDADWMATQASDRPQRPRRAPEPDTSAQDDPVAPTADRDRDAEPDEPNEPNEPNEKVPGEGSADESAREAAPEPSEGASEDSSEDLTEQPAEQDPAPKKSGRKGRRASVPSWDEIMFGGGRGD
jgi:hypothetical protein